MKISRQIRDLCRQAEREMADIYADIDRISEENTEHVLDCFRECEVSEALFAASTGYGYGDRGRDMIDELSAKVFRAPAGFMPVQLRQVNAVSGIRPLSLSRQTGRRYRDSAAGSLWASGMPQNRAVMLRP